MTGRRKSAKSGREMMLFFYALINMLNLICIEGSFACFCYDVNISDVFYFIFEKK